MSSRASCSLAAVVVEQSAETRPASDGAERRVVVARRCPRPDDLAADPLVVALGQVVPHELAEQVPQVTLAENDEVVLALGSDGFHETFRARVAIRTLRRNRHALHAAGLQQCRPPLGEHRIPVVDQGAWIALGSLPITRPRRSPCSQPRGVTRIGEGDHLYEVSGAPAVAGDETTARAGAAWG